MEIDENSEDLKSPLSVSITKYNSMSNSLHLFSLNSVGYATRQVGGPGGGVEEFQVTETCFSPRVSPVGGGRFQVQDKI